MRNFDTLAMNRISGIVSYAIRINLSFVRFQADLCALAAQNARLYVYIRIDL
jgi:hypothetical protein